MCGRAMAIRVAADVVVATVQVVGRERGARGNVLPPHHARQFALNTGLQDIGGGGLVACLGGHSIEAD